MIALYLATRLIRWVLASGVSIVYIFDFLKSLRGILIDKAGKNADVLMSSFIFNSIMGIKMQSKPILWKFRKSSEGLREPPRIFSAASLTTIIDLPFIVCFSGSWATSQDGSLSFLAAIVLILFIGAIMHTQEQRKSRTRHRPSAILSRQSTVSKPFAVSQQPEGFKSGWRIPRQNGQKQPQDATH